MDKTVLVGIRPDRITPDVSSTVGDAAIHGDIRMVEMMGTEKYIYIDYCAQQVIAKTVEEGYDFDRSTDFVIDPTDLVLFSPETEERIEA